MTYPHTFEEKIGFDTIRSIIKEQCISSMGIQKVESIRYSTSFEEILLLLEQVDEFRQVILFEDPFPAQDFYDLREVLSHIQVDGTYIELDELAMLRNFIQAIIQSFVYFKIRNEEGKFPRLWTLCQNIIIEKPLLESMNKILDPKGNLRDNASEELRRIKNEINKISGEADRKIKKLLHTAKQDGLVKEDAEMTIRNGRLCIPVPAQFKRRLKGFIHDESATGQTVFIEPTEVFDANNELKDLLNAERREIINILTSITNEIRPSIPNLLIGHNFIGDIDFIRAKAKWAIEINGVLPHLFDTQILNWQKAIHPLLFLNFKGSGKKVQPLTIKLEKEERILIISGPNAGGKSVCLKSVGLLQYMVQCGLLVSMQDSSDMGIFENFFIDMGDEQSIDNDLSTYSSHLRNLKMMIENLNARSLFLIDEFGSGTEPVLGGAMAEAMLETIYHTQAFGIITTHYGNLKMFPDQHPEAINGAMLFDTHALKPLFQLKIGKPGSSFTYEIARQIGLPEKIINRAIEKSGTAQIDYEKKLEEIEIEKIETETKLRMVHAADDQLAHMIEEYGQKFNELEKHRKDILQKAKNQATSILDSANKIIEKTIREIKETKADSTKTKEARKEIIQLKEEFKKEIESIEKEEVIKPIVPLKRAEFKPKTELKPDDTEIRIGDSVFMADTQIVGEVTQLSGNDITISFNSISFRTTKNKVTKISKKEARNVKRTGIKLDGGSLSEAMNKKIGAFKTTLDLRGKRAEEALNELEVYLDEAVLLGIHQVKILHGTGSGILRHVVRQFLVKRKDIKSFCDEVLELGGYGITIVTL
ncbi:MAG: Smr/MutS family protein [Bacteroidales bacterium]